MKLTSLLQITLLMVFACNTSLGADQTLTTFINHLSDSNSHIRSEAATSLGNLGNPKAVEPLIQALNDSIDYVRSDAARALGKIGDHRAVEPLIYALDKYPPSDKNSSFRLQVLESLASMADPSSIDALSQIKDEGDWNNLNQKYAVSGLVKTGDLRAIGPLINILGKKERGGTEISIAADGLVAFGKSAVEPLIEVANNTSFKGRGVAITTLGKIGDRRAVELLIGILDNQTEDNGLRCAAAYALADIGDIRAVDSLIQASEDSDSAMRDAANEALVKISSGKTTP